MDTIIHQFDLTPGGLWLNEMRKGDFSDLSRSTFVEITPQEKLVWHQCSADKDWNVIANPMMPDWPTTIATDVSFAASGNQTQVTLVWSPHNASDQESACFSEAVKNFGGGWEAGFAIMDTLLAQD